MDALTHAIEAYVSTASNPVTDACAIRAMKLISSYLPTAVEDGKNVKARDMMASLGWRKRHHFLWRCYPLVI